MQTIELDGWCRCKRNHGSHPAHLVIITFSDRMNPNFKPDTSQSDARMCNFCGKLTYFKGRNRPERRSTKTWVMAPPPKPPPWLPQRGVRY